MTAIETRNLQVSYRKGGRGGTHEAVRQISLRVSPGEVVGFIGPNGAGKSSTINALMGFRVPTAGSTHLFGIDSRDPRSRQSVGYLPEVALYYPWLTAMEALRMYGELQGLEGEPLRRRSEELIQRVGLRGRERERLQRYSKGMLQRLGIAQALLVRPRLLILDEVTSGLDPVGRRDVRDLLLEQREAGVTIFFSSHELTEVAQLCDRVIMVHRGRVIAEEVLDGLMRRLERHTLSAVPPHADTTAPVPGRMLRGRWRGEFETQDGRDRAAGQLEAAGWREIECGRRDGDLEEYFIATVGGEVN